MKKFAKRTLAGIAALCMCAPMTFGLAACGDTTSDGDSNDIPADEAVKGAYTYANYTGTEVQGVSTVDGVTTIKIGNTAATSGAFASVGVPFNYGLKAYLWSYSAAHQNVRFEFVHYDDEFTATKGLTYTRQLVEDDKVFALVGHFGTNTIEATVDYIHEKGVPMVYAATGVNSLYDESAREHEKAVMPIQPIYKTEGRSMLATAAASTQGGVGLGGTNIGVIYTSDDAGLSIATGIKAEATKLGVNVYYQKVDAASTDYSAAVNALKRKGCDVAIIAAAQVAFSAIATQFVASNYENVKIITSYVSANGAAMGPLAEAGVTDGGRELYAGAWLDIIDASKYDAQNNPASLTDEARLFAGTMMGYGTYDVTGIAEAAGDATGLYYTTNSYAMAGYVAGYTFTQGLDRMLNTDGTWKTELTWKGYIDAMESAPVTVAMTKGNTVDYANGSRLGVTALALNKYTTDNAAAGGSSVRPLTQLSAIEEKVSK